MGRIDETPRLLITGAAGKTGLAVLGKLSESGSSGLRSRALARRSGQRALLEDAGAQEVVLGDLANATALERAIEGVEVIYHICPNVHEEEVAIGNRMIELARRARVRRFVFHSVLEPNIREMPHHWAKGRVEEHLVESGLDFTILQPAPYMQNILVQWSSLTERGIYRVPYALSTRVSMVDLDDVAEAAVRVLTSTEHSGKTYECCAPGLLDQSEIAGVIGRVLDRSVRAETLERQAWAESARSVGLSQYQVETLLAMFRYYESSGMKGCHRALATLLGRKPNTFSGFVSRVFGGVGWSDSG